MNYNRKMYKNLDVIFWFFITALPLLVVLIWFIGAHITFNSGMTTAQEYIDLQSSSDLSFSTILSYVFWNNSGINLSSLVIEPIEDMFTDLTGYIGISYSDSISTFCAWIVSVQFYHLLVDFIIWLPKFFDNLLHRWGNWED